MSDVYKLVFRGEVLEGQHPAVVRKRLGESAGFADEALDKLFSGRPVVVKREADTATAAKFQAVFKKAGARLRMLPVETGDAEVAAAPSAGPGRAESARAESAFQLLPAGSDLLRADERTPFRPRDVDTSALSLEGARFTVSEEAPPVPGPDVSHLSVAEVGVDLGSGERPPAPEVAVPELDVAEPGADLGQEKSGSAPAVTLEEISFDVAPPGSELGQRKPAAPPSPPDTSHLSLQEDPDRQD